MPNQVQNDEISFISGVNANGTIPTRAFYGWNGATPAAYNTGYTDSRKWGADTAGTGATVSYYIDPRASWTAVETQAFTAAMALWSAVANITFVAASVGDGANMTFERGIDGSATTITSATDKMGMGGMPGGTHLLTMMGSTTSISTGAAGYGPIDGTFSTGGGSPLMTILHEEGHALGLGHAGPYNSTVMPATQQNGPYDNQLWTVMSYIKPTDSSAGYYGQDGISGTNWNGNVPTTWMPLDILAIQRLYGVATTTPLSGGQVFGFNSNITGDIAPFFDFTKNTNPVVTLWDAGTGNTLDLSGFSSSGMVNLNPGTFSSVDGMTNNIAIAYNTAVDRLVLGAGNDTVICNNDGDIVQAGAGNDSITGGTGDDTLILSGNRSAYSISQTSANAFSISGPSGTDSVSNVETLRFNDQFAQLMPDQGSAVNFGADPSTYMAAIRDYDGNYLGGDSSWKLIGTADVNSGGTTEHILVNSQIARWAEVGTEADGKTYFDHNGASGDTRVVGIYIDPLVTQGVVVKGSDLDSQRRFSNDLAIGNIHAILGSGDYNHDGLKEVYFSLTDGTAYLHAYMHADGNIQYANYQNQQQVIDYLSANGWSPATWAGWFPASQTAAAAPSLTLAPQSATSNAWGLATGS